jgi:hypothetical protein
MTTSKDAKKEEVPKTKAAGRMKALSAFEQESGNFWDEPLDFFRGGIMNINTYEN